jgi:tRNA G37 N-methylase Trm5
MDDHGQWLCWQLVVPLSQCQTVRKVLESEGFLHPNLKIAKSGEKCVAIPIRLRTCEERTADEVIQDLKTRCSLNVEESRPWLLKNQKQEETPSTGAKETAGHIILQLCRQV